MDYFNYQKGTLFAEDVSLTELAKTYGTPCYVYSYQTFKRHYLAFSDAAQSHPHLVCYAVKANSNLAILQLLAALGSGFDIVSGGELARVLKAGGDPAKVVFSGVAKSHTEIAEALNAGIKCFNVESLPELERINQVAQSLGVIAPVSLRINPDIDAKTHPYISTGLKENKFGIAISHAESAFQHAHQLSHLNVIGVDFHIGSQLTEVAPFIDALDKIIALVNNLRSQGIKLKHIDVGGGLGVPYQAEAPPHPSTYISAIIERMQSLPDVSLIFEPGRAIMANAGVLITEVAFLKHGDDKHFAIVDAGMNDLLRPSLYNAWQNIVPVTPREGDTTTYDVVGPVCETGDWLGKGRELNIEQGDLLAVRSAGAYGFTMSSNYNSRPQVAEVLVDGKTHQAIRKRQTYDDLWRGEALFEPAKG